jgi:hypothetical protein
MGKRGRQRVLDEFTTQRMTDAAVALYRDVCGLNPHDGAQTERSTDAGHVG